MQHSKSTTQCNHPPAGARPRSGYFIKAAQALSTAAVPLLSATAALAQAPTSPAGGIGAQVVSMAGEGINSGGIAGQAAMYLAALGCFIFGAWALWQSRMPQNRENGRVSMGVAGLVLAGLFASGGVWINKASVTTSGGNATVNDQSQMIQFGGGNGG